MSTRSRERECAPTDAELACLFKLWKDNPLQKIPMPDLCRFALASAMRLGEKCHITTEDVVPEQRAVYVRQRKDPRNKERNDQLVPLVGDAWPMVEARRKTNPIGRLFPYNAASVSTAFTRASQA